MAVFWRVLEFYGLTVETTFRALGRRCAPDKLRGLPPTGYDFRTSARHVDANRKNLSRPDLHNFNIIPLFSFSIFVVFAPPLVFTQLSYIHAADAQSSKKATTTTTTTLLQP